MIKAQNDLKVMLQALVLARRGVGAVRPNPMVGAIVLDKNGIMAGCGFHRQAGGPHAEIDALRDAGERSRDGTLFVTLEPCNHTGRTPPCVEAIIRSELGRVVVAMKDPNPHVPGGGVELLRRAGIPVELGVGSHQAIELNRPWIKWITTGRPFVVLKLALSQEDEAAPPPGSAQRWITDRPARRQVHRLRAWCDAVLTGAGTVAADNPSLTNRSGRGVQPLRIVVDSHLRLDPAAKVFDSQAQTLAVSTADFNQSRAAELKAAGVEHLVIEGRPGGKVDLQRLLLELGRRGVQGLLCEPGPALSAALLEADLVDEVVLYRSPDILGAGSLKFPIDLFNLWRSGSKSIFHQPIGRDTAAVYRRVPDGLQEAIDL